MEILKLNVLRGPNYWSNTHTKLIVLKLNLLHYETLPTNLLEGFTDQLKQLMPSLSEHRCSYGVKGGFFKRLESGTWLGHVVEHIALELQWLAGMQCGFGRTRSAPETGVYNVVYSYEIEEAGLYAGETAVKIASTLANQRPYTDLQNDIDQLRYLHERDRLGPSTESIVNEAKQRDIPFMRLENSSLIVLGQGSNQKVIWSTMSSDTSSIGVDLAADKDLTKELLSENHIPVPKGIVVQTIKGLNQAIKKIGFPLVIKPQNGNHGKGITTNIMTKEKAVAAFKIARKQYCSIIVEKFIKGFDYRLLVINYKLVAVAKRTPASITGDGISTIQELIDEANLHPNRGEGHQNFLTKITIDEMTRSILFEHGLTLESVLPKKQILYLKNAANLSSGGTAIDVTNFVHPHNIFLAERIARITNLNICGIDLISTDISMPLTEMNGAVIEVNAAPGFRMHLSPSKGAMHNVAKPVIDMLFPKGKPARIPLVAVTGTNGKTTVVRLIAHLARLAGHTVGFTCTDGIYIDNHQVLSGDCSGPLSAGVVLRDPIVNFAVFECARGGILRSGLGFDKCNISIVTNVSEDHLGIDDIHTIEEMARAKSVVPMSTAKDGYAILNADDNLVYQMKDHLDCNVALFSLDADNERIQQHCADGGLAAYIKDDWLYVQKGTQKNQMVKINEIPLTFSGYANCMVKNILPAILAAVISYFPLEELASWLKNFNASAENTPGRMNFFDFDDLKILVDYAHNEDAFIELKSFIQQLDCANKVGIIAATGDRRLSDIRKVGYYAAQMFDEIIIRQDRDSRGRTHQELTDLIIEGIQEVDSTIKVRVIPDEFEAIQFAIDHAQPDTFVMYFPDEILEAVSYVKQAEQVFRSKAQFVKE